MVKAVSALFIRVFDVGPSSLQKLSQGFREVVVLISLERLKYAGMQLLPIHSFSEFRIVMKIISPASLEEMYDLV